MKKFLVILLAIFLFTFYAKAQTSKSNYSSLDAHTSSYSSLSTSSHSSSASYPSLSSSYSSLSPSPNSSSSSPSSSSRHRYVSKYALKSQHIANHRYIKKGTSYVRTGHRTSGTGSYYKSSNKRNPINRNSFGRNVRKSITTTAHH